jgi:hypothetical protein
MCDIFEREAKVKLRVAKPKKKKNIFEGITSIVFLVTMRIANLTQSNPWFVWSNIYVRRSQLERQEFLNRMTTMVK